MSKKEDSQLAALETALRRANVELAHAVGLCSADATLARGIEHISAELKVLLDGLFPEDEQPKPLVICPDCLTRAGEFLTPEMNSEQLIIRLLRPVQVGGRTWMPADFEPPAGSAIWRSVYAPNHLCVSNGRHRLQPSPLCKLPTGSFEVLVERVSA